MARVAEAVEVPLDPKTWFNTVSKGRPENLVNGEEWLHELSRSRIGVWVGSQMGTTNDNVPVVVSRDMVLCLPVLGSRRLKKSDGVHYHVVRGVVRHLELAVPADTKVTIYRFLTAPQGSYVATFFFPDRHVSIISGPRLKTRTLAR